MRDLATRIDDLRSEARFRLETGKTERATELLTQALDLFKTLPADDPKRAKLCGAFASTLKMFGRLEECETFIREAIAGARPDSTAIGDHRGFYAMLLLDQGRLDEAETYALAALEGVLAEPEFTRALLAKIRAQRARP